MGFGEWFFIYLGCGVIFILLFFMRDVKTFIKKENKFFLVSIRDMLGWVLIPILFIIFWFPILICVSIEKFGEIKSIEKILDYRPFFERYRKKM